MVVGAAVVTEAVVVVVVVVKKGTVERPAIRAEGTMEKKRRTFKNVKLVHLGFSLQDLRNL